MSSILKALKKLEEEKSLRRDEAIDLPREILTSRGEKQRFTLLAWGGVVVALLLLVTTVTTLVITGRGDRLTDSRADQTTAVSPGKDTPVANPLKEEATVITITPGKAQKSTPLPDSVPYPSPPPLSAPSPEKPLPVDPVEAKLPVSLPASASFPSSLPVKKPQPLLAGDPPTAALTVSGIAWNKDSADRLAIINGQPSAISTSINGFLIEEILPDRVIFSKEGKTIEILIGKSGN